MVKKIEVVKPTKMQNGHQVLVNIIKVKACQIRTRSDLEQVKDLQWEPNKDQKMFQALVIMNYHQM